MKRTHRVTVTVMLVLLASVLFVTPAYANSSWHWLTPLRPHWLLPCVIVSTLAIEYFSLITLCNIKLAVDRLKALAVVGLANLMSFLAPFLFFVFSWLRDVQAGITSSFGQFADKMPCSFVGLGYLVLTLVVEVPLVYFFLKNRVSNKKKLLLVVVLANIATTLLVAVVQHLFLPGTW